MFRLIFQILRKTEFLFVKTDFSDNIRVVSFRSDLQHLKADISWSAGHCCS